MRIPGWLHFLAVGFPSANVIATSDGSRVIFDSGFGSDTSRIEDALATAGIGITDVELVVNTHWHSDHVGVNTRLRDVHGIAVAAAREDAQAINSRRADACLSAWLDQPVERYHVDHALEAGQTLRAGPSEWEVVPTPGHTPHHLSFYEPQERLLVLGDAIHADDVGWLNLALDGPAAIDVALDTVARLSRLAVRTALPGHGGPILDPPAVFAAAHARYERMRADPQRAGWHACKRIFAFALMIRDGIPLDDVDTYLARQPWLVDHASKMFDTDAETLAADLLAEMRRTRAVEERGGRLHVRTPHHPPARDWLAGSPRRDWLHEFIPSG
ncbi:hypothetical protein BL254_22295 [Protofrankia sp. BMG5.30]|nr:hypothetical protein BL254_22295 [Protofrankia sp. BMG5.30]